MKPVLVAGALAATAAIAWIAAAGRSSEASPPSDAGRVEVAARGANPLRDAVWRECSELYGGADRTELERELEAVKSSLRTLTTPLYEDRFTVGAYDVEGEYEPGKPYRVHPTPDMLTSRRMMPNGLVGVVTLRQQDHPEAYELMYRGQWLRHQIGLVDELDQLGG